MQSAILTITLNPTVDISTAADTVVAGPKLRCDLPVLDPGGGGLNVSRAIAVQGGQSVPFIATGGTTGQALKALVTEAGLDPAAFEGPGETRQSVAVSDRSSGEQYRFVMPGPTWDAADVARALDAIEALAEGIVVLSGSQPPGVPVDFPSQLARRLARTGARLIVDTSGAPLFHLAETPRLPPMVLRMDQTEADELAGHPLASRDDSADFAASLVARGVAEVVVVARGAEGSILVSATDRLFCNAAEVPVVSKVGAGDSFVGGFTLALARGQGWDVALRDGCASASAAVMTEATKLCLGADVEKLKDVCVVKAV